MVDGVINASVENGKPGRTRPGIPAFVRMWLGG